MSDRLPLVTYLFSDIEGSSRLWEQQPEVMQPALARHDALCRERVAAHGGTLVKMTGDGMHAAFSLAASALAVAVELLLALAQHAETALLKVRIGLHAGVDQFRDGDFHGPAVNRAARVMSAAHGGQILLTQAVVASLGPHLPEGIALHALGRVRLRDLAGPEQVYQVLHPQLRAEFPALRSLEATPNNLPQQLNSFIDREQEMADLRLLLGRQRMLTLLGMGGMGKSRLSVQLGAEVLEDFADGVWLVELAALNDPLMVPQAVASVLGLKEESDTPVLDALRGFVRDRQLLIVLDNCEHLIQACAELARLLLQAGPGVKLVATSRDHLGTAGETVFHVPPLAAPQAGRGESCEVLAGHPAVQLFVDRAVAGHPAFKLDEGNAAAVAEICARLDGIPLALEIAAARARSLPVQAIAARLLDRFRLLVSGDRTVLPRQRTLRALIDWSYDLLPPPEKALFENLSVFSGGFDLAAAERVGPDDADAAADTVWLLSQLVEKSLVVLLPDTQRYRMLETVRLYASERLEEAGRTTAVRRRHVAAFVELATQARTRVVGEEAPHWLARLDADGDNLIAAHEYASADEQGAEAGLHLAFGLRFYWLARGLLAVGARLTERALQHPGAQRRDLLRCRGLCDLGHLWNFLGRFAEARQNFEESLAIAREVGDGTRTAAALLPLGTALESLGELQAARAAKEEAVALIQRLGNPRQLAVALNNLAQLHRLTGDFAAARPLLLQVLDIVRSLGDHDTEAAALLNLAMLDMALGEQASGQQHLRQAAALCQGQDAPALWQCLLEVVAALGVARGNVERAALLFGAAHHKATISGLRRDAADQAFLAPFLHAAEQSLGAQGWAQAHAAAAHRPWAEVLRGLNQELGL